MRGSKGEHARDFATRTSDDGLDVYDGALSERRRRLYDRVDGGASAERLYKRLEHVGTAAQMRLDCDRDALTRLGVELQMVDDLVAPLDVEMVFAIGEGDVQGCISGDVDLERAERIARDGHWYGSNSNVGGYGRARADQSEGENGG